HPDRRPGPGGRSVAGDRAARLQPRSHDQERGLGARAHRVARARPPAWGGAHASQRGRRLRGRAHPASIRRPTAPGGRLMAARALVADDDEGVRFALSRVLEDAGLEVEGVADGEAALARVRAGGIALVVSDLRMPRLDGMQLLRALVSEGLVGGDATT